MPFGQVVLGPPGSGKSTYCAALAQYLASTGRTVAVVNLDPANDGMAYTTAVDVTELVDLASVMEETGLGPNGGLIWAVEYLEANLDWLLERLKPLTDGVPLRVLQGCTRLPRLLRSRAGIPPADTLGSASPSFSPPPLKIGEPTRFPVHCLE